MFSDVAVGGGDIHDTASLTLTDGEQANVTRDAEQANPEVETSLAGRQAAAAAYALDQGRRMEFMTESS